MQTQLPQENKTVERAGYFPVPDAHLYTVLHEVANPVARVLLIGPFASERHNSYLPWVRWARTLAQANIECLRYDYRGIGESTGNFEQMTFTQWLEDVQLLATFLQERAPHAPLILHGLGMGAVLAANVFHHGIGQGLLMWAPTVDANQSLRGTLIRWVGLEQIFKFGDDRKSGADYIRELEGGSPLEVDGYSWTAQLWRESFDIRMPAECAGDQPGTDFSNRPIKAVKLTREAAPLAKGGLVGYDDLKDFHWLYAPDREWIGKVAANAAKEPAYA